MMMVTTLEKHRELTAQRAKAYETIFGGPPTSSFSHHAMGHSLDDLYLVDVFVYTLSTETRTLEVAVTNGLSDQRMVDSEDPQHWARRELIQYFPQCTKDHAKRLQDMALLPLMDGFLLDVWHSVGWEFPALQGTPWKNGFFISPLIPSHREFVFEVEGDPVQFLWHVPISDKEREFKIKNGSNALIDRMEAVQLPWIFDEKDRPSLVD